MTNLTALERLKVCPFCGTRPKLRAARNWEGWWILGCMSVRCSFQPEIQHIDKQYAVRRWNKRA